MGRAIQRITIAALVAGCSNRPLVEVDDGDGDSSESLSGAPVDDDGVDDDRPRPDDDDEAGDVDVDDGVDDDDGTTGQVSECVDADGPHVDVDIWPGQDPVTADNGMLRLELDCTIATRSNRPTSVRFDMDCVDEAGPLDARVNITVSSEALVVPAELTEGAVVQARVYTFRDPGHFPEFAWRRADHFVLYRDGALVFAGGSGLNFAATSAGEADPAFYAPIMLPDVVPSGCPGVPMECHDPHRSEWLVTVGDLEFQGPPFQFVHLDDYDLQLGELSTSDSADCGEPGFGRVGLTIVGAGG